MKTTPPISKTRIFITAAAVVVVSVMILSYKEVKNLEPFSFVNEKNPGSYKAATPEELQTVKKENIAPALLITGDPLSYSDAVTLYGDKRIQFDEGCRATPSHASFLVGDTVVIDNRSDASKVVKFIDDTFMIPSFHIKIVQLDRQGIFSVDCGTSKNVATIIVH